MHPEHLASLLRVHGEVTSVTLTSLGISSWTSPNGANRWFVDWAIMIALMYACPQFPGVDA